MSMYIVADEDAEFGIAHIDADSREEAATEYVQNEILDHHGHDVNDLDTYNIGVVLENDVKYFTPEPSFKITTA